MAKKAYKMVRSDFRTAKPARDKRDIIRIRETLDELAVARCPLCHMMLIARMGRRGPGFYCRCTPTVNKVAA
jgi:ssDNA-binding Zn-finger/Zn-ribbon topoisomerase 1